MAQNDTVVTGPNQQVQVYVLGNDNDPQGDRLALQSVGTAANGTVQIVSGASSGLPEVALYSPSSGFSGTDTFTYVVTDGARTATATVSVTVDPSPPLAQNDTVVTGPNQQVQVYVLGNDNDPQGDRLALQSVGTAANGTVQIVSGASSGLPEVALYSPSSGFSGTDTFTYVVTDGARTATATVSVTVDPSPPLAQNDTVVTGPNQQVQVYVLGNDNDPQGDRLALQSVGTAANGTVQIVSGASSGLPEVALYSPSSGFSGTDTFTYVVTDGARTATATVSVTVDPSPPLAQNDTVVTGPNQQVQVYVLGNDNDPQGDRLALQSVGTAANGTVQIVSGASSGLPEVALYSPSSGFSGTDTFTYVVTDGARTATATVSVTVLAAVGPNDPPVAVDDTVITRGNQAVSVYVTGNDTDADGDPLTVDAIVTSPTNGSVSFNAGAAYYTPTTGFAGTDTFTYRATDGAATSSVATVTVTVDAGAPVAVDDTVITRGNQAVSVYVTGNDTDADGDPLTVDAIVTSPTNGSVSFNAGAAYYTPTTGFAGTDTFTYRATDGAATSSVATVTVTVDAAAPVAVDDTVITRGNQAVSVYVTGNDIDADGDPLTVDAIVTSPTNGSVSFNAGAAYYTPTTGFAGTDTFTYRATDGAATSSVATVTVTVDAAAPVAVDDTVITRGNQAVSVYVTGNDTDADGDPLTVDAIVTSPTNGSVSFNAGAAYYTPTTGFAGTDTFTYRATDGAATSSVATVTVTVL